MSSPKTKDLAASRQAKIADVVRRQHIVRVNELCAALSASPASIRRDLAQMERRGALQRVHGGAVGTDGHTEEPPFDDKAAQRAAEKQRIAKAALTFVRPSESIFLDGGSTVLAFAALLKDMTSLTVVTNSLRVASLLAGGGPRLILTGGELRRVSQTFVGPLTSPLLDQLHVDTAFMGTIGLSVDQGVTTTDPREAYTKERVMAHAGRVVLLADSSKIGRVSLVKFGAIDGVDVLITDRGAAAAVVRGLRKQGVPRVVVA